MELDPGDIPFLQSYDVETGGHTPEMWVGGGPDVF